MGWGGAGVDNNVPVPARAQAPQPHHFSCRIQALLYDQLPVGGGGVRWDNNGQ